MRRDRWSGLLHFTTLALAGTCLVYAERDFLPEMQVLFVPFLVLVFLAWRVMGERWVLPVWGANVLAVLIVLASAGVLYQRYERMYSWLPYLGPVLMALLLVKLFRSLTRGDFWVVQGLGLLQVGLGCVLAKGAIFGGLLLVYLASALCCLAAHHRQSERAGGSPPPELVGPVRSGGGRMWARFALRWTLGVAVLVLLLFLVTPRGDGTPWEPLANLGSRRQQPKTAQTGLSPELNLNRVGVLEVDQSVAFAVTALDAEGQPKLDLPGDQRWRGAVLDDYADGRWSAVLQMANMPVVYSPSRQEPPIPPGGYELHFTVEIERAGGLILADPVPLGPTRSRLPVSPLASTTHRQRRPLVLFGESSGTVLPHFYLLPGEHRYRQVVGAETKRDRYPAVRVPETYAERMVALPRDQASLRDFPRWAAVLLGRLADQPRYRRHGLRLPTGALSDDKLLLSLPEQWAPAAQLLTEHLSHSGEYTYSLALARQDPNIDPTVDFLRNVKQGHCERYSAGLALMLRALGIPCRIVKGFRGTEHQGDGQYVVRQSQAHSSVEVLVPRTPPRPGETPAFDWLVLDPTPDIDAPTETFSLTRWWDERRRTGGNLWQELIVGYDADHQADLWRDLVSGRALLRVGLVVFACVGLALLVRARRRRRARRAPVDPPAFYARLLALLERQARLRPELAQTPREFAERARVALSGTAGTAALADVPERVVDLHRARFGGRPLDEAERRGVEAQLDALAAALVQQRCS